MDIYWITRNDGLVDGLKTKHHELENSGSRRLGQHNSGKVSESQRSKFDNEVRATPSDCCIIEYETKFFKIN